jgi:hypothetical protein
MIKLVLSKPTKIKFSVISIFTISVILITQHSLSILGVSLPFAPQTSQPVDTGSLLFSILINIFLVFTVWLKIRTKVHLIPLWIINIFIVVLTLFILMLLQSLQAVSVYLGFFALVNIISLLILLFYKPAS